MKVSLATFFTLASFFLVTGFVDAQINFCAASNELCTDKNINMPCPCSPAGFAVSAKCVGPNNCQGTGFTGQDGKSNPIGDMSKMAEALKGIMDKLMEALKGGGGGGGGSPPPPPTDPNQKTCTSYYQVTVPSSDHCAYYVPPTSDSLLNQGSSTSKASTSILDTLLGSLGGSGTIIDGLSGGGETTQTNVSDQIVKKTDETKKTSTTKVTSTSNAGGSTQNTQVQTGVLQEQKVSLKSGTQGDIEVTAKGATIIASGRDVESNTEVAGFYGGTTLGTQPQGIAANMCRSRPWTNAVVSFIIPPSFFDSLCAWRGFQVGSATPTIAPAVTKKQTTTTVSNKQTTPTPPPAATVDPEVDIWAVPSRVPLGARTSIFWNTKGVEECAITSPDGSFNEKTVSGGASTVPLSGATTFTISCLTPDGKSISDHVVVNLTI